MAQKRRDVYMHRGQRKLYYSQARDLRAICGRRWGKSQFQGARLWQVAQTMPRKACT